MGRRDALAALAAAGVATTGAVALDQLRERRGGDSGLDRRAVETLVAVASVVYPDAVEGIPGFVETYTAGRVADRSGYVSGVREALGTLDEAANDWHGAPARELDPGTLDALLRELGCDTAAPDPGGTDAERVRYYVVNELLFALYSSPTGGELVGIENPQGHPGGTTSYRRGPDG